MSFIMSLPPSPENYDGLPAATNTVIGGGPPEDVEGGTDRKKPRLSPSSPYGSIFVVPRTMKISWPKSVTMESDIRFMKQEGLATIDLEKTWEQLDIAARDIAVVEDPHKILVASDVLTPVPKFLMDFAKWTSTSVLTRPNYTRGTLSSCRKPSMLIITYPKTDDHLCLIEEAYLAKIPMIAFCEIDCPTRFLDGATIIPATCNQRPLSCLFTLLARMIWQKLGLIPEGPEITIPLHHEGGSWDWYPEDVNDIKLEEGGGRKLFFTNRNNDTKTNESKMRPRFGRSLK